MDPEVMMKWWGGTHDGDHELNQSTDSESGVEADEPIFVGVD